MKEPKWDLSRIFSSSYVSTFLVVENFTLATLSSCCNESIFLAINFSGYQQFLKLKHDWNHRPAQNCVRDHPCIQTRSVGKTAIFNTYLSIRMSHRLDYLTQLLRLPVSLGNIVLECLFVRDKKHYILLWPRTTISRQRVASQKFSWVLLSIVMRFETASLDPFFPIPKTCMLLEPRHASLIQSLSTNICSLSCSQDIDGSRLLLIGSV